MGNDIKKDLKKIAQDAQVNIVRSILNWKYKREGRQSPDDETLERQSRRISRQANDVIVKRGKNVWNEFKKAYNDGRKNGKGSD